MTTFISRFADSGPGLAVAIKDLIDVAGVPTTGGSRALDGRGPATADAACLREIRRREAAGEVWLVGKTNLHELAYGVTGVNPWFGTPTNPLDPRLVPGGSSSGSAAAVAVGEADVALGTDTGGSVRIPAACCGIAGLKTTWGRVPLRGVWPLAPSLDTVGPMARDVAGLVTGMALLEPGFAVPSAAGLSFTVGRLRTGGDPAIEAAIDAALVAAEVAVGELEPTGWREAWTAADLILRAEAWRADGALLEAHPEGIGAPTAERILSGRGVGVDDEALARRHQLAWQRSLDEVFAAVHVVALPTLVEFPPPVEAPQFRANRWTLPVNLAGLPAVSIPVPTGGPLPAGLQLVGPAQGDELVLAIAARIEAAIAG
jgi:amidase